MSRIFITSLALSLLLITPCFSQSFDYTNPPVQFQEQDGSPSTYPYRVVLPNNSLTDTATGSIISFENALLDTFWHTTNSQTGLTGDKSGSFDLGTTGKIWANSIGAGGEPSGMFALEIFGTASFGAGNIIQSGDSYLNFNSHLLPYTDNSFDLGSTDHRWREVYATTAGTNTISDYTNTYPLAKFNDPSSLKWDIGNDGYVNNITAQDTIQAASLIDGAGGQITGGVVSATSATLGSTLTLATGSITDSSGAISFDDENLTTTGTIEAVKGTFINGITGANDAPLIVQNTNAYADPWSQYSQVWRDSSGNAMAYIRNDGTFIFGLEGEHQGQIRAKQMFASTNGTESSNAYSWFGDSDTGWYRIGADNIGMTLGGTKRIDYSTIATDFTALNIITSGDLDLSNDTSQILIGEGGLTGALGCDAKLYSNGTSALLQIESPSGALITNPDLTFTYYDVLGTGVEYYIPVISSTSSGGYMMLSHLLYVQDHTNATDGSIIVTAKTYPAVAAYLKLTYNSTSNYGEISTTGTTIPLRIVPTGDILVYSDNKKIALGAAGTTDSYLQWDTTNLEIVSSSYANLLLNGAAYFDYPSYTSGLTINDKITVANQLRVGMASWVTATADQSSGGLYGFFGGYQDSGASAVSVGSITAASGYNYLQGTNARTFSNVYGGYFFTELAAANNITFGDAYGIYAQSVSSGYTAGTNAYAGYFAQPGGKSKTGAGFTNNYGLYIEEMTVGDTINNEIFIAGAGEVFFRDQAIHAGSLNDGYLDLTADTGIRLNSPLTRVTGDLYVGNNADVDPAIVFDADTSDGQITWDEDNSRFLLPKTVFSDAIYFTQTDGAEKIDSDADGDIDIYAGTSIDLLIGGTEQITLTDGKLAPTTNNDIDLGDDTHRFKDLYLVGSSIHMGTSGDEGTLTYTTATNTWDASSFVKASSGIVNRIETVSSTSGEDIEAVFGAASNYANGFTAFIRVAGAPDFIYCIVAYGETWYVGYQMAPAGV